MREVIAGIIGVRARAAVTPRVTALCLPKVTTCAALRGLLALCRAVTRGRGTTVSSDQTSVSRVTQEVCRLAVCP